MEGVVIIMRYTSHYISPFGGITLAADGRGITGLWFDGQKYFGDTLDKENERRELPVLEEAEKWLDVYFSGKNPGHIPPLHFEGTSFRRQVWDILLQIPYGTTITYGKIARLIAEKRGEGGVSARAVGGAVGHNPISIFCPCHRVVGSNGSLTGYSGGLQKKVALLTLEHVNMEPFFLPKKGTAL